MNHLDLFTGIGCFSLAAKWVWEEKHKIISFCEKDENLYDHLNFHFPGIHIEKDIKKLDATKWRGTIDLVTAGVPCQPASTAGKHRGKSDDRWLWPETLRVVGECQPRWAVYENPSGILTLNEGLVFEELLAEMEGQGYSVWPLIIPACGVGAPHIRYRVWIIAHAERSRQQKQNSWSEGIAQNKVGDDQEKKPERNNEPGIVGTNAESYHANADSGRRSGANVPIQSRRQRQHNAVTGGDIEFVDEYAESELRKRSRQEKISWLSRIQEQFVRATAGWRKGWNLSESRMGRVYDGFADRFYEIGVTQKKSDKRIEALGNAVVPAIPFVIFKYIAMIEDEEKQSKE